MLFPRHAYLVCSTQRSGSTYLCSLLASTGVAGGPQEYFEGTTETGLPPHPGYFLAGLPPTGAGVRNDPRPADAPSYSDLTSVADWHAHLERTFRLGTTPNGVFSTKLMWNQLPEIQEHALTVPELAGLTGVELLTRLFGNPEYVWIRRRDKVRQAISLWRALQTRRWRLSRPDDKESSPEPTYSFEAIEHLRRRMSGDDQAWGTFFLQSAISPLELIYEEDVEPDPRGAVLQVLKRVGVDLPQSWTPGDPMARQSDHVNDAWRVAYDQDAASYLIA